MKTLIKSSVLAVSASAIFLAIGSCVSNQNMLKARKDVVGKAQKTGDVPNMSKAEICKKLRDWIANTFMYSKAVIEVYDLEEGTIIGKGSTRIWAKSGFVHVGFPIRFTMQIDCREGRYRFAASNPVLTGFLQMVLGTAKAPI